MSEYLVRKSTWFLRRPHWFLAVMFAQDIVSDTVAQVIAGAVSGVAG